jgi:hypothetical protein
MNDLLLEHGNTKFQIDSLFISKIIHLFEVNYFEGDRWYTNKGIEIKNPLQQMERAESLLRRLVRDLLIRVTLKAKDTLMKSSSSTKGYH